MNNKNTSLVDRFFSTWTGMSAAGKVLAGGTALVWLLWLFWLPIAQNAQPETQRTFLPSIIDENDKGGEIEQSDQEEGGTIYLPSVTDD